MHALRRLRSALLAGAASLGLAVALSIAITSAGGAQQVAPPAADAPAGVTARPGRPLVVVVHGMGRTSRSMRPVVRALEGEGYDVLNFGYSSYCCTIAELGAQLQAAVFDRVTAEHTAVHFVGHSLGNILVRWVLTRDEPIPRAGRVVMLAPPNAGSHSADRWAKVVGWLLEPIDELRTDSTSTVRRLPPVRGVEIGVISGGRDGKVRVDESHLAEETEHVVVPGYHSFLMRRDDVLLLTRAFLRDGRFGPATRAEPAP